MNREEWLEWRRFGIGSSDAAVIMGVSPWKTLLQLYNEKVFGNSEEFENSAMKRGKDMEETARKAFEEAMNVSVFPKNVMHPLYPWARASLDGIDLDGQMLVEIKCPGKEDHLVALNGMIPQKYYPQCQHQLMVTELPSMYYYSFDGIDGVLVEVKRDAEYIADLMSKELAFWQCVLNKTPPEMGDDDLLDLGDDVLAELNAAIVLQANKDIKSAEDAKKDAMKILKELAGERSAKGHSFTMVKSSCPGRIDYEEAIKDYLENMRAHYPNVVFPEIALEPYRKESFTKWTVRSIKE